jgi:ABC-2 type transport system ATP-binding protein
LLHTKSGTVRVLGRDPVAEHRAVTESVGYLSQRFSLYGDLSVDENVAFFAEIHGVTRYRDRRERLLELMQLTPFRKRLAERLSGGMKQKLALACTLVHQPALILLDEPTTGVDPVSRREFWKLLSELLNEGITIIMTTPYLDEAERCTRIALITEGELLAADAPDRLRAALPGSFFEVIAQDRDKAADLLRRQPGVMDVQLFGDRAHVRVSPESAAGAADALRAAFDRADMSLARVRPIAPSLEDVFIARLAERSRQGVPL